MRSFSCTLFRILVLLLATSCVPTTITRTRMEWKPYAERENRQEKEGVIAELHLVEKFPPSFFATVQACDQYGRLLGDRSGNPQLERVSFARPGQFWRSVALTNQTQHVIRLNLVAIRVFDPAGNQIEPLTKDDLYARLLSDRPCISSNQAVNQFKGIRIFDRNMEIVPGTTSTFWIAFAPPSTQMPGVWKFAIYEVPVKVNEAGQTLKATRFEMRLLATKFVDTYSRDPFGKETRVNTIAEGPDTESTAAPTIPTPSPALPDEPRPTKPSIGESKPRPRPLSLSRETISRVQVQLKALGFDPGAPDGAIGPRTREALRRFQNAHSLPVTGEIDTATLEALGVRSDAVIKY